MKVSVIRNDGAVVEIDSGELSEYVTEVGNPRNEKNVREVSIELPSAYLKDGVRLIDTPGVGSVYLHNTDVAYRYLPHCDAALFLLSVEQPVGKAELDFLRDVQVYSDRIFFLLNKIDTLSDSEIEESIAFSRNALQEAVGPQVKIFPVSAKLALRGKIEGSEELLEKSRLAVFATVLNGFLMEEKGKVLLSSAANALLRILQQGRLEGDLELKALTMPLDELKEKIATFERKQKDVLTEKEAFRILLEGELKQLARDVLDEDLAAFKNELVPKMEELFEIFCAEHRDLSLRELNDALEKVVTGEVEKAISTWRSMEEDKMGKAFQSICDRFLARINDIIDALFQFSSQLFAVPFEPMTLESRWKMESRFTYKFEDEPVGLDMLTTSLTQVWPSYISGRFKKIKAYFLGLANRAIVRRRKEHLYRTIEMHAGRIRSDLVERLNASAHSFRREMLYKIESTAEGIAAAVDKGLKLKTQGEQEMQERLKHLHAESAKMDEMRGELLEIKNSVAFL